MSITTITPAAFEPLTIEEARAQCRCGAEEDVLLGIYIAAAREACETIIRQNIVQRLVEQTEDGFPAQDDLQLREMPVYAVALVEYADANGTTQALPTTAYAFDPSGLAGGRAWLSPALGTIWPTTEKSTAAVRVQYVSGFAATPEEVPAAIKQWLLMTVALLYGQRESMDAGGRMTELPSRFVDRMLDRYVQYSV
jgi:uncharacterized phiE125 gp8 family phage protein